jgi:hypothetical protein
MSRRKKPVTIDGMEVTWPEGTRVFAGHLEVGEEYRIEIGEATAVLHHVERTPHGVPARLRAAATLYEERNAIYGSDYLEHGKLMLAYFPEGIHLKTAQDLSRYA